MDAGVSKLGDTYDSATASGNTTLVNSSTDNPAAGGGIILTSFDTHNDNNAAEHILSIGGNAIYHFDSDASRGKAGGNPFHLPLYIEAGDTIVINHSATGGITAITWEQV